MPIVYLIFALLFQPLHLEASTTRSEFAAGDRFTISAHLFNDSDIAQTASISIAAPPGFEPLTPQTVAGEIAPHRALDLNASYQVAAAAPVGLYRFMVRGGGQTVAVVVRIGPVVAPPAVWRGHVVWMPVFRA